MKLTKPRLILAALLLAIGVSAVWWGPEVYSTLRYSIEPQLLTNGSTGESFVELRTRDRWGLRDGVDFAIFSLRSGFKRRTVSYQNGAGVVIDYHDDGRVKNVVPTTARVADQTEPTLPGWLGEWAEAEIARREAGSRK